MVASGKGRARSNAPNAAASQAESRESTVVDATSAPIRSREVRELEGRVNVEHLQSLSKRVAEQEEYVRLLWQIKELEQEQSDLALHTLCTPNKAVTLQSSKGAWFDKHTVEYRSNNIQELCQWIRALEDDYENFLDTFVND